MTSEPDRKRETGRERSTGRRRALEVGGWVAAVSILWTLDTLTKIETRTRTGFGLDDSALVVQQVTSALAVLLLIPGVAIWLRYFPWTRAKWVKAAAAHLLGSGLFATAHYTLFVLFRRVFYGFQGMAYMPDQKHLGNLVFEYKKDVKIYLGIVLVVAVYKSFRSAADAPAQGADTMTARDESDRGRSRLAVQTGSGEEWIEIGDIEYLEAAANYVQVHAAGRRFLVRQPLRDLHERLPEGRFVRTHRSFVVSAGKIRGQERRGSGKVVVLESGARVPVSRTHRKAVRSLLNGAGV